MGQSQLIAPAPHGIQTSLFDYDTLDSETRVIVQQRTTEIKGLMKRAAQDIIDIGQKLIEVKARLGHGSFGAWLAAEFDWSYPTANRFMNVAETFKSITVIDLPIQSKALYLLAAPSTPEPARIEALERAGAGEIITHAVAQQIKATHLAPAYIAAEHDALPLPFTPDLSAYDATPPPWDVYRQQREDDDEDSDDLVFDTATHQAYCKYCYATHSDWQSTGEGAYVCNRCDHRTHEDFLEITQIPDEYDGDEWYTPADWISAARDFYDGAIDLDPASCIVAQEVVQARVFFTKADNGLARPWFGNVWCNPPYSTKLIQQFAAHADQQYQSDACTGILLLVNNCTDARWFMALAAAYPVVFSKGRTDFWYPGRDSFAARQGQALFYMGYKINRFYAAFSHLAYAPNWWLV